ncbi:MAG: hypothetical protein L6271_02800, partial [Desulfobacteraceae bacterium]|nr:hypothetical protein [Desulfobacteraceae bacterium]
MAIFQQHSTRSGLAALAVRFLLSSMFGQYRVAHEKGSFTGSLAKLKWYGKNGHHGVGLICVYS